MQHYLGIDIGSIAIKAVAMDENKAVLEEHYLRIKGAPIKIAKALLADMMQRYRIFAIAATGSGAKLLRSLNGSHPEHFVNEIVAQARAATALHPKVRTVIEIGGEDSKLIRLRAGRLVDFSTNTVCAAGTGSFLDQQASRLGLKIEEFGKLALKSKHPPRIAGRCTVFAKSDMIHLQQKGTPDYEIVAGLCLAVARNFVSNLGQKSKWKKPICLQGGVAANIGVVRAFERVLELEPGKLIIPQHFAAMGAIGAVLHYLESKNNGHRN